MCSINVYGARKKANDSSNIVGSSNPWRSVLFQINSQHALLSRNGKQRIQVIQ